MCDLAQQLCDPCRAPMRPDVLHASVQSAGTRAAAPAMCTHTCLALLGLGHGRPHKAVVVGLLLVVPSVRLWPRRPHILVARLLLLLLLLLARALRSLVRHFPRAARQHDREEEEAGAEGYLLCDAAIAIYQRGCRFYRMRHAAPRHALRVGTCAPLRLRSASTHTVWWRG